MDILQKLTIKDHSDMFIVSAPIFSVGKTDSMKLLQDLKIMQQKSICVLVSLSYSELNSSLEPTPTPHPIATTKFESIDWNIKHTLYHCGQIGILRRIVNNRYDFGLRANSPIAVSSLFNISVWYFSIPFTSTRYFEKCNFLLSLLHTFQIFIMFFSELEMLKICTCWCF
jgi:hypothetical protein